MKQTYYIQGMHCPSCEQFITRKFKKIKGVKEVSFSANKVEIQTTKKVPIKVFRKQLENTEYSISEKNKFPYKDVAIGISLVVVTYFLLKLFEVNSFQTDNITLPVALIMGLLASVSTCMAVSGGFLLALSTKVASDKQKSFHVAFNVGRIISYTVFGALLGLLGTIFQINTTMNGIITLLISLLMIFIGLQLLGLLPPLFSAGLKSTKLGSFGTKSKKQSGIVGALSFFFPCGFTQALQLYAVSTADPVHSGLVMLVFSLGTLPALSTIGIVTTKVPVTIKKRIPAIAAAIIIIIGATMILPALTLLGINPSLNSNSIQEEIATVPIIDGYQVVEMKVRGLDYYPHQFVIKKDIPVKWIIEGSEALGCAKILTAPKLNIATRLSSGNNILEFTPTSTGEIPFHCSMAMTTPNARFEVIA